MECARCNQPLSEPDIAYCDDCMTQRWAERYTAGLLAGLARALTLSAAIFDQTPFEHALQDDIIHVREHGELPDKEA